MATPIMPVLEIDVVLDSFTCTVHATLSAVAGDTDLVRVNRFKLYLLTAMVPLPQYPVVSDWNQINMLTQEAQALKSAKEY